jgi:hypothetical protein
MVKLLEVLVIASLCLAPGSTESDPSRKGDSVPSSREGREAIVEAKELRADVYGSTVDSQEPIDKRGMRCSNASGSTCSVKSIKPLRGKSERGWDSLQAGWTVSCLLAVVALLPVEEVLDRRECGSGMVASEEETSRKPCRSDWRGARNVQIRCNRLLSVSGARSGPLPSVEPLSSRRRVEGTHAGYRYPAYEPHSISHAPLKE